MQLLIQVQGQATFGVMEDHLHVFPGMVDGCHTQAEQHIGGHCGSTVEAQKQSSKESTPPTPWNSQASSGVQTDAHHPFQKDKAQLMTKMDPPSQMDTGVTWQESDDLAWTRRGVVRSVSAPPPFQGLRWEAGEGHFFSSPGSGVSYAHTHKKKN